MKTWRAYCFLLSLLWASGSTPGLAASINDFVDLSLPNPNGGLALMPGRLYVPPEASTGPRPIILFLHGAGEAGRNNSAQVNGNIDNLLAEAKRRGAFLLAPQSTGDWTPTLTTSRAMQLVDRALAEYSVDDSRMYVTGLSNGGGGTWNFLNRYGDRFAAAIPICGIGPGSDYKAANLLDEPIWAFHARNDSVVSVNNTRNRVNDLLTLAGESRPTYPGNSIRQDFEVTSQNLDLRYTEYYTGDHGIWGRVYNTPTVYDWLFSHTSPVPEPQSLSLVLTGIGILTLRRRQSRSR